MKKGYIRINRSCIDEPLYFSEPFTKWQAWCDLIMLAYISDSVLYIRGIRIETKRGCVYVGTRELAERWKWSRGKVIRFMDYLIGERKIVPQTIPQIQNVIGCISINNFDSYQSFDTANSTANGTTNSTTNQRNKKEAKNKENIEEENKEKKLSKESIKKETKKSEQQTQEEINFANWMKENFPYVCKMSSPLTLQQFRKVQTRYTNKEITTVLMNMDNWSKLSTKRSAYQTLLIWIKKDYGERNITAIQHSNGT